MMLHKYQTRKLRPTEFLSGKRTSAVTYTAYLGTDELESVEVSGEVIENLGVTQYCHYIVTTEDGKQYKTQGENYKEI